MLKSKQMRDGAVDPREDPYELHGIGPIHAPSAEARWNCDVEQSSRSQQVPLGFSRTPPLVAFHGGLSKCFCQLIGNLESMLTRRHMDGDMVHCRNHSSPPLSINNSEGSGCCCSNTFADRVLLQQHKTGGPKR